MTVFEEIRLRARHIWLTLFGALVLVYFTYHIFHGNHGVVAMLELQSKVKAAEIIHDDINTQEKWLELQVNLLRKNNLDSDMLDERVRVMLNYVHPDELVIISGTTD
ncbi:MAG: septum formation initiator [Rhodospirillaceae bacterium]|nr:septum formation initiator [Rhodospirillaceae bacterium]|tara:strand:- start:1696 stop:2016 length:321 start_codon:yes stop_codon:yes gene_type:complete